VTDDDKVRTLARALDIPELWAELLQARGIDTPAQYAAWIEPNPILAPARELPDLLAACDLVRQAIRARRRIRVHGDYDCDGVTATALLVRVLKELGADVDWRVPNRFDEGYGLSPEAVFQASQDDVFLLITVDCGSSSPEAGRLADSLGLGLVITDHHRLPAELPLAAAHVNPERMPLAQRQVLSGAGVALQMARELLGDEVPEAVWALAALGTVADVVPVRQESRAIVRRGLEAIQAGALIGLNALIGHRDPREVGAGTLGFVVGPRINAAGRMGSPDPAVQICLTDHPGMAAELARELEALNQERRAIEAGILREAMERLPRDTEGRLLPFLLVAGDGWHEGVLGIVAARIAERFGRPTAVVSVGPGGQAKGSARLGKATGDILAVLRAHQGRFAKLGGHKGAAGFSLSRENLPGLAEALAATWAAEYGGTRTREVDPDAVASPQDLTPQLGEFLEALGPFGHQFPPFRFRVAGEVQEARRIGQDGRHLRLRFRDAALDHVLFGAGTAVPDLVGRRLEGEATLEANWWRGERRWQVRWTEWRWPERAAVTRVHVWRAGVPAEPDGLILVESPRALARTAFPPHVVRVWPWTSAAEIADLAVRHRPGTWYAVTWWHPLAWDGPPLSALWALAPPPHRWALRAALAILSAEAAVYWAPTAEDRERVGEKWTRLVPDRERLLRVWRARQAGHSPLLAGRRVLRDLGLESPGIAPRERRSLETSVHYRTGMRERQQAAQDWRGPGPAAWEEVRREQLADAGAGDS
jgi:single-stranded-DNA-specific exonuclease